MWGVGEPIEGLALRRRLALVASYAPSIAQTALAASVAWLIATDVLGRQRPFFAPVGAIIALGVVLTSRVRRAVEIVLGVSVGVLVADLVVIALGSGFLQIALVVVIAMALAIAAGGGRILVGQAATSAVLVATIDVPDSLAFARPVDALVGGLTALAVGLLILPLDPRRLVDRSLARLTRDMGAAIDRTAAAIAAHDHDAVEDALDAARELEGPLARYTEAVTVGRETVALAPLRRGLRPVMARHTTAAEHLGLAVRNVRSLARGALRAVDLDAHIPRIELEALEDLARAVRAVPDDLAAGTPGAAARHALRAAERATAALELTGNLSLSFLTGHIRSAAVDVLRALGVDHGEARARVQVTPGDAVPQDTG